MSKVLRLLLVEDSDDDAELVLRELRRAGYDVRHTRVQTRPEFQEMLVAREWDVIVSDHTLPQFSGMAALAEVRAGARDLPFILVSGTVGESGAVAVMRAGAHDYVLKDDLTRLPAAVEREVREARARAEQRRMREQLLVSERMAAAGTLAAGVAHEINNPLAVALANAEFIAELVAGLDASTRAEIGAPLADVQEALTRIRDIVRDVKLFSRPGEERVAPVDLRKVIDSSVRMAWNELRHRARVVKDFGADVPLVSGNESRLGQVVLNLVVNAAQAMPEGHAAENRIRVATLDLGGGFVAVDVEDTGPGMSEDVIARMFEPFFTTKPVGQGTGLGLAICHRIVTEIGGTITVASEVGRGTRFRVTLPIAPPEETSGDGRGPAPPLARRARVLVLDDEVAILRLLARGLAPHHDVQSVTSGREAIARVEAGERFDAIVSDLMMPEVTGMEVYERLLAVAPDQARRMIFLTGGTFTARSHAFLDTSTNPRVDKPFAIGEVLAAIGQVA